MKYRFRLSGTITDENYVNAVRAVTDRAERAFDSIEDISVSKDRRGPIGVAESQEATGDSQG